MFLLGAETFGLGQRCRRYRDLSLELAHVELRGQPLLKAPASEIQRGLTRNQRTLRQHALLIQLEERQVSGGHIADQREQDRALGSFLGGKVGSSRLHPPTDPAPEIQLPCDIRRHPKCVVRRRRKGPDRHLIGAYTAIGCQAGKQWTLGDPQVGPELLYPADRRL